MKCLRCQSEMKHYDFQSTFKIVGAESKPRPFESQKQHIYNPQSVYICKECGYVEFSISPCENPDI